MRRWLPTPSAGLTVPAPVAVSGETMTCSRRGASEGVPSPYETPLGKIDRAHPARGSTALSDVEAETQPHESTVVTAGPWLRDTESASIGIRGRIVLHVASVKKEKVFTVQFDPRTLVPSARRNSH